MASANEARAVIVLSSIVTANRDDQREFWTHAITGTVDVEEVRGPRSHTVADITRRTAGTAGRSARPFSIFRSGRSRGLSETMVMDVDDAIFCVDASRSAQLPRIHALG